MTKVTKKSLLDNRSASLTIADLVKMRTRKTISLKKGIEYALTLFDLKGVIKDKSGQDANRQRANEF